MKLLPCAEESKARFLWLLLILFTSSPALAAEAEVKSGEEQDAAADTTQSGTKQQSPSINPFEFGSKPKWKPGMELSAGTDTQELVPTDDPLLAAKQVQAYPDSPEASFILAVALTRTSRVEEALKEVRRARKLAEQKGGAEYFDKMISVYEDLLKNYPNENRVRYGLAWAYYMKAYLLANYSKKVAAWKAANGDPAEALKKLDAAGSAKAATGSEVNKNPALETAKRQAQTAVKTGKNLDFNSIAGALSTAAQGNPVAIKIPSITDNVEAQDLPQIRKYYEMALQKLDEMLAQKPDDVWALVYRAHLKAEYSGNLVEAMQTWTQCRNKFPNNPASYFFLGEGFLKQGNLKESLNNVSKAVALRAMGY